MQENKKEKLSTDELEKTIQSVLSENKNIVDDYKSGKESVLMYLMGQTMRQLGKKVDARIVLSTLKEILSSQ